MERRRIGYRELLRGNFLFLMISGFLFITAGYIVMPMLPIYLGSMGAMEAEIGFIVGLVALTAVFTRIPVGVLIDRHGRRGMLLLGIFLQAISPFLYTLCTDTSQFMFVRVLNGIGWAAFIVTADTLVVDLSPRGRLGEVIGIFSLGFLAGHSIGPMISGIIQSGYGFTATFYASGILGLIAAIIALQIKLPRHTSQKGLISGFASVSHNRNLLTSCLVLLVVLMPHGILPAFLPLYATSLQIGPEGIGLFFTVFALSMGSIRPFVGALSDRVGRVAVVIPFALLASIGVWSFAMASDLPGILMSGILLGVGVGAAHSGIMALSVDTIPPELRGQAVAIAGTATDGGVSIGAICMGPVAMQGGFSMMFQTTAVLLVAGSIAFLGIRLAWKKKEKIYT